MRILWFSVTPSLYNPSSNSFNGGGWIAALEQIVRKINDISLGVAFMFNEAHFKDERDGVSYYPIPFPHNNTKLSKLKNSGLESTSHYHCLLYTSDAADEL